MVAFPEGFLWGVSTAGHQIEGGNKYSDWYEWEKKGKVKGGETSETACGSWERFERDIKALEELGVKAYRYSIEWARIEPESGKFDEDALERYAGFIKELVSKGIHPVVTLNHFVLPLWFARMGGWEKSENLVHFEKFVRKVVQSIGQYVHYWVTVNEPNVYASMSYLLGEWPPQKKDIELTRKVLTNLIYAHTMAYDAIKSSVPTAMVSIALNMMPFLPFRNWHPADLVAARLLGKLYNYSFVDSIKLGRLARPLGNDETAPEINGKIDFLGINYYSRTFVKYFRPFPQLLNGQEFERTDMGYEFFPQGLEGVVFKAYKRYRLPIMITENGIADSTDKKRWPYIDGALQALAKSMKRGAKVFGYLYWSLMDNFEWKEGYSMKFGLYETVRDTMELKARPSAESFRRFISENR